MKNEGNAEIIKGVEVWMGECKRSLMDWQQKVKKVLEITKKKT